MTDGIISSLKSVFLTRNEPLARTNAGTLGGMSVQTTPVNTPVAQNTSAAKAIGQFFTRLGQGVSDVFTSIAGKLTSLFSTATGTAPNTQQAQNIPQTPNATNTPTQQASSGYTAQLTAPQGYDATAHAPRNALDSVYTKVQETLSSKSEIAEQLRNDKIPEINVNLHHFYTGSKAVMDAMSDLPADVKGLLDQEASGITVSSEQKSQAASRAAANMEALLTAFLGGTDPQAIRQKANAVPQALCDLVAIAVRSVEDHIEAQTVNGVCPYDQATIDKMKQNVCDKILGNRLLGPSLTEAKSALNNERGNAYRDDRSQHGNYQQIARLLTAVQTASTPASSDFPVVNAHMKEPFADWRSAFVTFSAEVMARGNASAQSFAPPQ